MMKLRVPTRNLPNSSNSYRFILSHALYIRNSYSLFISYPYLPRRQLWLNHSIHACKWGFHILCLPIPTCRTGPILWILYIP
uniref:Uncharacterized protein n=1 Tax=Neovison vison TaxID=452646 RepID=A0A8C7BFE3_NEOVI